MYQAQIKSPDRPIRVLCLSFLAMRPLKQNWQTVFQVAAHIMRG
jgi:hypothetical protein